MRHCQIHPKNNKPQTCADCSAAVTHYRESLQARRSADAAKMRERVQKQRHESQVAHALAINPHRELIISKRILTPEKRADMKREATSFSRMNWYLKRQAKAVELERYVTATFGCRTSWARIEEHGKYYVYYSRNSKRGRVKAENWLLYPIGRERAFRSQAKP